MRKFELLSYEEVQLLIELTDEKHSYIRTILHQELKKELEIRGRPQSDFAGLL